METTNIIKSIKNHYNTVKERLTNNIEKNIELIDTSTSKELAFISMSVNNNIKCIIRMFYNLWKSNTNKKIITLNEYDKKYEDVYELIIKNIVLLDHVNFLSCSGGIKRKINYTEESKELTPFEYTTNIVSLQTIMNIFEDIVREELSYNMDYCGFVFSSKEMDNFRIYIDTLKKQYMNEIFEYGRTHKNFNV